MRTGHFVLVILALVLLVGCRKLVPGPEVESFPAPPSGGNSHQAEVQACLDQLAAYWGALQQHAAENEGRLPTAASVPELVEQLGEHAPRDADGQLAYGCKINLFSYSWNDGVNGQALARIRRPATVPLVYDDPLFGDHGDKERTCAVLYADGSTAIVPKLELRNQVEASQQPRP